MSGRHLFRITTRFAMLLFWAWVAISAVDRRATYTIESIEPISKPFTIDGDLFVRWQGNVKRKCEGKFLQTVRQNGLLILLEERAYNSDFSIGAFDYVTHMELQHVRDILSDGSAELLITEISYCTLTQRLLNAPLIKDYPPVPFRIHIHD